MSPPASTLPIQPLLDAIRRNYPGPCLIFELRAMREAAASLARIGRSYGTRFIAAVKALPGMSLLEGAAEIGGGFDVANIDELDRLLQWWRESRRSKPIAYVSMTGPALLSRQRGAERFIEQLSVNVEAPCQLAALDALDGFAAEIEVGARIGIELGGSDCGSPRTISRFGFSEHDLEGLAAIVRDPRFAALHCHVEGDGKQAGSYALCTARLMALAQKLAVRPRRINLGGGLRHESLADIETICRDVRCLVPEDIEVVFEPGAWLTARAGYAFCRVLFTRDRADTGATFVVVDLSRECHVRWDQPQLIRWWGTEPRSEHVSIFGPTCYEADHLGTFRFEGPRTARAAPDSGWLLFGGVTGYAAALNMSFNGIPKATVLTFGNAG